MIRQSYVTKWSAPLYLVDTTTSFVRRQISRLVSDYALEASLTLTLCINSRFTHLLTYSSSSSKSLTVSRTRLSTVGDRAFPVAAALVWNSLPEPVTSAPSVAVFRSRLEAHLLHPLVNCTVPLTLLPTLSSFCYLLIYLPHNLY